MGWYCPMCWTEWGEGAERCLICDARPENDAGFEERLIAGLRAKEGSEVQWAATILAQRQTKLAVPELIRVLETSHQEFVLEAAASALGRLGDRAAIASLCQIVKTAPYAAREAAAVALARLRAVEALPLIHAVIHTLGSRGLQAIDHLEGRAAEPPTDARAGQQTRPALGGDPVALVRRYVRSPGCGLCALISEDVNNFFAQWVYHSVLCPRVRERFRERGGFCPEHTGALRQIASPQALDVVLPEVLARIAVRLADGGESISEDCGHSAGDALQGSEARCQACALCAKAEVRYAGALVSLMEEDGFRQVYAASSGVCMPHFVCLRERAPGELRPWLDATQGNHLRRLAAEMQSHREKLKQRLRHEITREEERAPWQALDKLAGNPNVKAGITRRLGRSEALR